MRIKVEPMMWKQVVAVCAIALGLVSGSMCVQAQSSVQEDRDAFLQPVYTIDIEATAAALQPVGTVLSVSWWYENGQKRVQGQFQERGGSAVGRWMIWHPNGQLLLEAEFTEEDAQSYGGEPVGVWRAWYANGQPFMRGEYGRTDVYGVVPTGVWTWWHENGMLRRQGGYAETPSSRKNGGWTDWHANGQMAREGYYVDGLRDGLWTWWHDNGVKAREVRYVDGVHKGSRASGTLRVSAARQVRWR